MANPFIQSHIKTLPIFARLTPEQLDWLTEAFQVLRFDSGKIVFQQGRPTQGMFVVVDGRGVLTQSGPDGVERHTGSLSDNQYINEAALFAEGVESSTLRVTEASVILFLSRQRLDVLFELHPEIEPNLVVQQRQFQPAAKPSFPGQRANETALMIFRRHPWVFLRRTWLPVLLMIVLLLLASTMPAPLLIAAFTGLAFVLPGGMMLYFYLEWHNDRVVITDQRVIREERVITTLRTTVSEVPLERVHEVNAILPPYDPFARLFNYGAIFIKTAGDAGNVTLTFVPNPRQVQEVIFTNRKRYQELAEQQQRVAIRGDIEKILGPIIGAKPQSGPMSLSTTPDTAAGVGAAVDSAADAPPLGASLLPFQTRYVNEKGETVYRKHIAIWWQHMSLPLLLIAGSLIALVLTFINVIEPSLRAISIPGGLAGLAVGIIGCFWVDWDWRNDMYIVGDRTVTLIHRRPLWLQNQNDQILLSQVDSVVASSGGLFDNLLGMGDVRISLVGGDKGSEKVFERVPQPEQIQAEISSRQARTKAQIEEVDTRRQREAIAEYLTAYHETLTRNSPTGAINASAAPPPTVNPTPPAAPVPRPLRDGSRPPGVPRILPDSSSDTDSDSGNY